MSAGKFKDHHMAGAAVDTTVENPALARQAAILARPMTPEREMANAIRALSIDGVEAAKCGHPGLPATASCCPPAMAPCCCIRCCT
jgi:uncharacterized Zn-binding protein involved in type VI secretion